MRGRYVGMGLALIVALAATAPVAGASPEGGKGDGPGVRAAASPGDVVSGFASREGGVLLQGNTSASVVDVRIRTTAERTRIMASATAAPFGRGSDGTNAVICWLSDGGGGGGDDISERVFTDISVTPFKVQTMAVNGSVIKGRGLHRIRFYCGNAGHSFGGSVEVARSNLNVWGVPLPDARQRPVRRPFRADDLDFVSGSVSRLGAVQLEGGGSHSVVSVNVRTTASQTRLLASASAVTQGGGGATDAAACRLTRGSSTNAISEDVYQGLAGAPFNAQALDVNGAVTVGRGTHTIRLYCRNPTSAFPGAQALAARANLNVWGFPTGRDSVRGYVTGADSRTGLVPLGAFSSIVNARITTTAPRTRILASATGVGTSNQGAVTCILSEGPPSDAEYLGTPNTFTDTTTGGSSGNSTELISQVLAKDGAIVKGPGTHDIRFTCGRSASNPPAIFARSNLIVWAIPF